MIRINLLAVERERARKRVLIPAVAVVILGGGGFAATHRGPKPTPVETATVAREDVQAKVTANGKVQAQRKVEISATIAGQVTAIAVREGDLVKKGQFLLQIDAVNPRAAARSNEYSMQALREEVESARTTLAQARVDLGRVEQNYKAGIVPAADLDRARTAVRTSEAAVQMAERRVSQAAATLEGARDTLAKTTIRSPMDGIVTARRVEEGEVAVIGVQNSPGTVLLTISDMSVVEAELEVDETSIPSVKLGQEARVRLDAYPNQTFRGVVTEVGSSPLAGTQNEAIKFKVKVQLKNPPPGIKPGLSVQADILTGFRPNVLTVPLQALVVRDAPKKPEEKSAQAGPPKEEEGVFLSVGGKAEFKPIKTGLLGELSLEVVSGLQGGESLISGPFRELRSLKPGDQVKEQKAEASGPPRG